MQLNASDMMTQCFYDNNVFIYLLFALAYLCIARHIPPLIPFSTINNISISVNNSNFTPVFFKQDCNANPSAEKK